MHHISRDSRSIILIRLEVNGKHAYVLNLSDYTDKFEELMGMSADAAVAGLDTKATVFYPINTTRNQWLKTAYTKDGAGWDFNSAARTMRTARLR